MFHSSSRNTFTRIAGPVWKILLILSMVVFPAWQYASAETVDTAPVQDATSNAPLSASAPVITLNVPSEVFIGQDVSFSVTFNNNDVDPGYGPFVDVAIDRAGYDGDDGLGTILGSITASYMGEAILATDFFVVNFVTGLDPAHPSDVYAQHPFLVDATGQKVLVAPPAGFGAGDLLLVARVPFGSFTQEQPPAQIDFKVNMSTYADLNYDLHIAARGGYEYGYTPLNDWCCGDDPSDTLTGWTDRPVTPVLYTFSKAYDGLEGETATGPNFRTFYPDQYTLTVNIAPGQSLSSLSISDLVPDTTQYFELISSNPVGASCTEPIHPGPTSTVNEDPGGTLTCTWGSAVSGTVTLTFDFYIPRTDDSGTAVLNATTGNDVTSCNNMSVSGSWTPLDPDDAVVAISEDPAGCEAELTYKSIATQKAVTVLGGGDPAPGQTLIYNIDFQISDFFAFDTVVVTDVFSDGQRLDTSFTPELTVYGNGYSFTRDFADANFDVDCYYTGGDTAPECESNPTPWTYGETELTFRVSDEIDVSQVNGRIIGGCVDPAGSATAPDCDSYNNGATYGTITFQTIIQEEFSDDYPSGDKSVDQGDVLDNVVGIDGHVLSTFDFSWDGVNTEDDGSAADVEIGRDDLTKTIYAVVESDGTITCGPGAIAPAPTTCPAKVEIKPSDKVTYRLTYDLLTSDVESMYFEDYLPLPIYHADDPDEDGDHTEPWVFDDTVDATIPAPGVVKLGPDDTFHAYMQAGISGSTGVLTANLLNTGPTMDPVLTANATNNRLTIAYATYDDTRNLPMTVDLLFTVTVSDEPFADRLYLTNQAQAYEGSTNGSPSTAASIVQVVLTEPILFNKKGVVWTDNVNATYTPDPASAVAFGPYVAAGSPRWSGVIGSDDLTSNPIDSNISGVDAGDIVTFAITIQNVGSSGNGAFDIMIEDTLPDGFEIPAGGLHLQAFRGSGTAVSYTGLGGGGAGSDDDLFYDGIELTDPGAGEGACQMHTLADGNDVVIVTYDLQVSDDAGPGVMTNITTITNYAGTDGGPNHVPTPSPLEDDAEAEILTNMVKEFVSTEIVNANNDNTHAVIGEFVTYRVTITVPEGETPGATLTDTLDAGLAFVDIQSVTYSSNVSSANTIGTGTAPANVTVGNASGGTGNLLTFDFGKITNADRDNTVVDTITLVYRAVVLDVAGNQGGTNLNNQASYTWTDTPSPTPITSSANNITVIEPVVITTKGVSLDGLAYGPSVTADAGDTVYFMLILDNPSSGSTDAYNITWEDTLPANLQYQAGSLITGSCPTGTVDASAAPLLKASVVSLAPGDYCLFLFETTVKYTAEPGNTITNTATTKWTSLNDSNDSAATPTQRSTYNTSSTERTGAGGVNDYTSSDTADVAINNITPNKYLSTTSEGSTGSSYVTIGEIVRYRLTVVIPEGTSNNFQVVDRLPAGMVFLDDGTARAVFVSNDDIASSSVGTLPVLGISDTDCQITGNSADGTTPAIPASCAALDDSDVGSTNSTATDADTYSSGFDVYFKLGTLLNSDSDGDAEYVVIEFNALVDNSSGGTSNDAGETLTNDFIVTINGTQNGPASNTVDVNVLEPSLTVSKSAAIDASRDAGDTVTYTLTVNAASGATRTTAFDLALTDVLNANLTPVSVVRTSTTQGGTCSGGTAFSTSQSFTGQTMNASATCLDPGSQIVFTITATLKDTTAISTYILENDADLTYTSLPGTNGTTSNATGSQVTGGSGTSTGERNGNGTAPNDYTSTSPADLTLTQPSVVKVDPSPTSYTIGQTVTYDIRVTLPEGVTQSLVVTDNIPSGTKTGGLVYGYKYVSSTVLANDATLTAPFSGPTDVTLISGVCAGSCVTGDDVTFTFGDVTTDDDNVTTNNTFIIRVTLLVENVRGNQDIITPTADYPTTLVNAATVTYTGGTTNDSAAAISVIEPRITTTKNASPTANVKAGDTVTYTVRFTNTGHSNAYDVTAQDTLGQGMNFGAVTSCNISINGAAATPVAYTTSVAGSVVTFDGNPAGSGAWDIPYTATNSYIECVYTAIAQTTFWLNGNHTNSIDADWTSLDGVDANERSYIDQGNTYYNFDGTQDTVTRNIGSVGPTLTKSDGGFTAGTIGDTIHYTITVGGANAIGTIRQLVITDTLPAGVIYDGNVVITGLSVAPVPTVSSPNDGSTAVTVTWTFGDVYKSVANATIEFDVHISDNNTTVQRTLGKTNSVAGTYRNVSNTNVNLGPATDGFTIIEPIITTTKDASPLTSVQAGDTVTYTVRFTNTGDSTAYDVTALDTLAQGVVFGSLTGCVNQASVAVPTTVTDLGATLTFDGNPAGSWDIAVGNWIQCTYTAIAQTSLYMNGSHVNTVDADWTSKDTATPTYPERIYDDSVSRTGVDGTQDTDTATFTSDAPTFVKDDSGVTQVVIGDTITFHLTVGGEAGTYRSVVIADHLPIGLIYNNDATVMLNGAPYAITPSVSAPNDGTTVVDLTWNFGDIYKNSSDMVITYSARVANVIGNSLGDVLINNASFDHHQANGTPAMQLTDTEQSTIAEPVIMTTKTVSPLTGVAAGDVVTYTVEFENIGSSTAYEVSALDVLAQGVNFTSLTSCLLDVPATDLTAATTVDTGTPGQVTFSGATWDIPATSTVTCIYTATAQTGLYMDGSHVNTIDADWTSQNGIQPNERVYDDSVSRTNVDETPGLDDDDATFTSDAPTFVKDDSGVTQVVIGDTITFHLTVGGDAGTYRDVLITDVLPAGLIYNAGSSQVTLNGSTVVRAPDSVSAPNDGSAAVTLTWDFNDLYKDGTDMVITYTARVANVIGNQINGTLINNAAFDHDRANGTPAPQLTDTEQSTITEPVITFTKAIISLPSPLDAGGVVHYQITYANGVGANVSTAQDVHITDALASELRLISTSAPDLVISYSPGVSGITNSSTTSNINITIASVPAGESVTVDFYPVIQNTVTPGQVIDNIGNTTWTSMSGPNANERDGSGGVNDYTATSSDDFTVPSPYSISKQITTTTHGGSTTEVAVGDVITYDILLTLPEGTTPSDTVVDNMPAGLVVIGTPQVITTTAADGYGVLAHDFAGSVGTPAPVITVAADGSSVQFDFTNVVVTGDDDTTNNTILLRYTARVTNDAVNADGRDIPNDATNTAGSVVNTSNVTHITVVEPVIVTTKSATPTSGVEAGDVITYTTRFTNTGTSTAYEVTAQDTLPANVDYNSDAACVYFDGSSSASIAVTVTGTATLNFGTWDIPATAPDSYVECVYSITTQSDIALGATHTNVVDADWTSLNGTDANERNYDDSVSRTGVDETPGADDDDAAFTTDVPASLNKGINVTQTAIGDVFHITITIVSPLGALSDTSVEDVLPAGMVYVNGTQSVTANITAPTFTVTGPNDGTAATTLTWDFGNPIVTGTPVVITYDARAANVAGNVDGTNLVNNVTFNYTDGGGPHTFTDNASVTVIEPLLTVNKTHSTLSVLPDAGDTVHYIVDIAPDAASTATAYDVAFTDSLPSAYVALNVSSITVTATGWTPTSVNTGGSTVSNVDVRVSNIPNTPGTNLRIEYDVTLKTAVTPAQLIANTGDVTWTSTSGTNPNERDGSGGVNDYHTTDTDNFNIHDPAFSKSLVLTDLSSSANPSLVIGEVVTFGLHVTLPEGTTPSLRIVDDLPAGLQYVDGSVVVIRTSFNGTVADPTVTPVMPIASGTDIQLDFGAITVSADNNDANNVFTVQFQAVVLDEAGNTYPDILTNNATMTVFDGGGTPAWSDSDDETVDLIEPVMTITKAVSDLYPGANQVLTFTLTVENMDAAHGGTSTADAYDVVIYDDLPSTLALDLTPASFTTSLNGGSTGLANISSGNRVEFTVAHIPLNGSVQIQFKATVASTVVLSQTINNTAYTDWTSKPGDLTINPQERTAPGTSWDDYRANSSITLEIQKSLSKSLTGHSLGATALNGGVMDVAIGEVLTYDVNFNVPVGPTTAVTVTDTLDTGLAFVDCVTITPSAGITASDSFTNICNNAAVSPVYNPADPAAGGRIVTFDFGNLNNSSGAVGLITIQYQVVVLDVSQNTFGVDLNNSVRLDWSVGPLTTESPTPLNIVEPQLSITKVANVDTALPGQEITFTLTVRHTGASTADAYDVILEDILPSGLSYVPGSLIYVSGVVPNRAGGLPALDDTGDPTLQVYWDVFGRTPLNESVIQFRATLGSLSPGATVSNTARVEWTSLPGAPGVQSIYNARSIERWYDPTSPVDIYGVTDSFMVSIPLLPQTGFAPGIETILTSQSAENAYQDLGALWMEIPALGVQMPIVGVPTNSTGWDLTWLGSDAGYLEGTAYPTWAGNTGITGHVTLADGQPGPFANLSKLYWGQQVIIHMDGQKYIYEVRTARRVWPEDITVLGHAEYPTLTLITCQGYNQLEKTYTYRVAVQAVLVRIEADDQPAPAVNNPNVK